MHDIEYDYVVIDTCAFVKLGVDLENADVQVLYDNAERLGLRVATPQVVFDELVGRFERETREGERSAQASIDKLNRKFRHIRKNVSSPFEDWFAANASSEYKQYLNNELTRDRSILIDYPEVSHQVVTRRASRRVKPFQESGKGYRDTLIWLSIVELLKRSSGKVYFITSNTSDFCDKESNSIHKDLLNDLQIDGIEQERVEVVQGVPEFVSAHVRPHLDPLKDIAAQVNDHKYQRDVLSEAVKAEIELFLSEHANSIGYHKLGLPKYVTWVNDATVISIRRQYNAEASLSDRDSFGLWFQVDCLCGFNVDLDREFMWGEMPERFRQPNITVTMEHTIEQPLTFVVSMLVKRDSSRIYSTAVSLQVATADSDRGSLSARADINFE